MLRSLLRFSIRDVLWLTVGVAVAVGWWVNRRDFVNLDLQKAAQQRRLESELQEERKELQRLSAEADFDRSFRRIVRELNVQHAEDRKILQVLKQMEINGSRGTVERKPAGKSYDYLEVLLLHSTSWGVSDTSVAAIMCNDQLVGVVLEESTRHNAALEDVNDDGNVVVVFNCYPGRFSQSSVRKAYRATTRRFEKVD